MPWSEEKKAIVEVVIKSPTYTSSDESDFSEDENTFLGKPSALTEL